MFGNKLSQSIQPDYHQFDDFEDGPSHAETRFYQSASQTYGYPIAFAVAAVVISFIWFI